MNGTLRHLLLALALLFGQQAAQLHAVFHLTQYPSRFAGGEDSLPPAGHPAAQCLVFHAVDSAVSTLLTGLAPVRSAPLAPTHVSLPLLLPPRIAFDSRAPPILS